MTRAVHPHRKGISGALVPMSPVPDVMTGTTSSPSGFIISKDQKNVYCVFSGLAQLGLFSRDLNTGALTALSPSVIATSGGPSKVVESLDGANVYVTNGGYDSISQYSRNTSTGQLTALSPATVSGGTVYPNGLALTPDGKFLYVSNKNPAGSGSIQQYSRATGTGLLTVLSPSSVASGSQPRGVKITPDGAYLYASNGQGNTLSQYSINTTTGQLTPLSPATVSTGVFPSDIVISPDGKHLYVCNDGSATVGQYSITAGTGLLAPLSPATVATRGGPWSITMSLDGISVYVANSDDQSISAYTRNTTSGLLTAKTPAYARVGAYVTAINGSAGPQHIAVSENGAHVYATGGTSDKYSIAQFHVNQ
jgi:6-phosphogluconolactonase (cycloisomerase 2 family)